MAGKRGSARGARKRRGESEDMTGKKEAETEVRRVEPTQMKLPSGKRILEHIATVEGYDGKIGHLQGKRRQHMAVIKAEGINPKLIPDLIRLKKADALEYREYMTQLGVGLKAIECPVQLSVFDIAFGDSVAQAKAEGALQGRQGVAVECRWPEGSAEFESHMAAYSEAQAGLVPGAQQEETEEELEEENA